MNSDTRLIPKASAATKVIVLAIVLQRATFGPYELD